MAAMIAESALLKSSVVLTFTYFEKRAQHAFAVRQLRRFMKTTRYLAAG
ncbi:hypothetical protein NKI82_22190 [Mesorhizobium sp. M0482]